MTEAVLECRDVVREFSEGATTLQVLRGVNLAVKPAERVAIIGTSGSGKTTLLQIMGGLDEPTHGGVFVNGAPMHGTTETAKGELRNRYIGFVYHSFSSSILNNVLLFLSYIISTFPPCFSMMFLV